MTILRNSSTLYFQTLGAVTTFPWTGSKPDFSNFALATQNVLNLEWELNQNNIQIVPDLDIVPPTNLPNWLTFGGAILQNAAYKRYMVQGDKVSASAVNSFILGFYIQGDDSNLYPLFIGIWGDLESTVPSEYKLSTEERQQINDLAAFCYLPFRLDSNNLIYIVN